MIDFAQKYDAVPFDENSANDLIAEQSRQAVINAHLSVMKEFDDKAPRYLEFLLAGMLVGLVQVMKASCDPECDQTDANIRASILQTAPWAVDFARAAASQSPLFDSN